VRKPLATIVLLALLGTPIAAGQDLARAVAEDYEASLAELFMELHSHPELSFLEHRTAARLAAELRAAGVEVTEGVRAMTVAVLELLGGS
jgi:metal-dependent amidase/aminoacylase/carboxypeptidase family protein